MTPPGKWRVTQDQDQGRWVILDATGTYHGDSTDRILALNVAHALASIQEPTA